MLFIGIENNKIVAKLDYKPNISEEEPVKIIEYTGNTPAEFISLIDGKICDSRDYIFFKGKNVLATEAIKEQLKTNKNSKTFLTNTDWKILRHIEQVTKNLQTSLSEEEYQILLNSRQKARESIEE